MPSPAGRSGGTYLKLERKVGDFATVAAAVSLTLENGIRSAAPASASRRWGSRTSRRTAAEAALAGARPARRRSRRPAASRPRPPSPVTDVRGTEEYKRHMVEVYVRRGLARAPRWPARPEGGRRTMQITFTSTAPSTRSTSSHELLLVHVIREDCGLTGTHIGCDTTSCGACTVLLDGTAGEVVHDVRRAGRRSRGHDRRRAAQRADGLHPIQAAFKEHHGLQCGFCTPGMMLVGAALLEQNPTPSDDDVRWAISGNICRCTGYMNIVKAIQAAAAAVAPSRRARERLTRRRSRHMATETEEIRGIGHSVRRKEDDRFIRGAGNYIDDIHLPGMLHMAILRSPYAHATINGIDASSGAGAPRRRSRSSPAS